MVIFAASLLVAAHRSDSSAAVTCTPPLGYINLGELTIEPNPPVVGQDVVVHSDVFGFVFNLMSVRLNGAAPLFEGETSAGREATYELRAIAAGETDLSVSVFYQTESECYDDVSGAHYYRLDPMQTKTSDSVHVRVYGLGTPRPEPHGPHPTLTPSPTPTPTPTPTSQLPFCGGDCDDDGVVTSPEQALGVEVALGRESGAVCPGVDVNNDGDVEIDDLVLATDTKLSDCLASVTPMPMP